METLKRYRIEIDPLFPTSIKFIQDKDGNWIYDPYHEIDLTKYDKESTTDK